MDYWPGLPQLSGGLLTHSRGSYWINPNRHPWDTCPLHSYKLPFTVLFAMPVKDRQLLFSCYKSIKLQVKLFMFQLQNDAGKEILY